MKLSGNTILITGGSTGIGLSLAESFLSLGNEVIICGRREDKLIEAQKKHSNLHIKVCDVANGNDQKELFEWATTHFPNLNILINNAGIQRDIDLTKGVQDLIEGDSEIKINLETPILLTAIFIPHLMLQSESAVINVSSGLAFMPMARVPIYCATKAALHTYTILLRKQLLQTGIKIFEVIPPMVDTELNKEGRAKNNLQFRGINSDEYVASVIRGLAEDEYEIYYGLTENIKNASRADLEKRLL